LADLVRHMRPPFIIPPLRKCIREPIDGAKVDLSTLGRSDGAGVSTWLILIVRLTGRALFGGRTRSGEDGQRTPLDDRTRLAACAPLFQRAAADGLAGIREGGERPGDAEALHVFFEFGGEAHITSH
jgi:hypothetical protein